MTRDNGDSIGHARLNFEVHLILQHHPHKCWRSLTRGLRQCKFWRGPAERNSHLTSLGWFFAIHVSTISQNSFALMTISFASDSVTKRVRVVDLVALAPANLKVVCQFFRRLAERKRGAL